MRMRYRLVKMNQLSGNQTSIYSVYIEDEQKTLLDRFIEENKNSFISELKDILSRLSTIANKEGAREQYFKTKEGKPGDLVCALYDRPKSNLRLYCIRFGSSLIILGGGGNKPKTIRALQENAKLKSENEILIKLSDEILKRQRAKEIIYLNDFMDFEGDLEFEF